MNNRKWMIVNIASLILLGVVLQIGGAYIVNAAVECLAGSSSGAADAAQEYRDYMQYIRSIEPRQFANVMFVAPLVEEIVFRLIFLRAGKMIMPFWAANLVQSVLFAIYHKAAIQKVYVFVMGLVIGCVFYYCPIIYRRAYGGEGNAGDTGRRGLASLVDLPNSLFGVGATFILHCVINTAGLFVAPLLPADIPLGAQFAIGGILMGVAGIAVYRLYTESSG